MKSSSKARARCVRFVVIENGADAAACSLAKEHEQDETVMIAGAGYDLATRALRRLDMIEQQGQRVRAVVLAVGGEAHEPSGSARSALVRALVTRMSSQGGGSIALALQPMASVAVRSQVIAIVDTLLAELRRSNVRIQVHLGRPRTTPVASGSRTGVAA
jgi:hypothetical protein